MNEKSCESQGPHDGRGERALPFILAAIGMLSILMTIVEKWTLLPALMRYLLAIILLVLGLALLTILFRKWVTNRARRLVRDWRTKRALRSQLPKLDDFVRDLQKVVADRYVYSLAAVVGGLCGDSTRAEEMQTAVASLGVLRQWVSCFSGEWDVAKQRVTIAGARNLLMELRFLLREVESIARQCKAHVPTSDGEVDELHGEPAPHADIRNTWNQFSARYNRLVEDYRKINNQSAKHLQGLPNFEFDAL